ncbi:MAG: cytochrome [Gemmatimonadetes bacterium]|nr:cytochrome [Gemmatimonadota bacterium]
MHWLLALAILAQLALGWWMLDVPKQPPGVRAGWFNLHKSIGLTIALATVTWLAWRLLRPRETSRSMEQLPRWQRVAARANHSLLFALMVLIPLSGLLGSFSTRYPVLYFGIALPGWNRDWPEAKHAFSALHFGCVWLFMILIAVHAVAGLWHWWKRHEIAGSVGLPVRGLIS